MSKFIRFVSILALCIGLHTTNISAQKLEADGLPSSKGKKVLIVYGDWPVHSPKEFVDMLTPGLEKEGAIIRLSDSLEIYTHSSVMNETDLIIQSWTMSTITKPQENGLLGAIKNGAGFTGCHGGTGDSFRNNETYQYMVGGQ